MVNGNCAVIGCTNSTYRLKIWKKSTCEIHEAIAHKDCPCEPPFRLHTFPSKLRFGAIREGWIRAINRVTKRKTPWQPGPSDTVCSRHFVNGVPTAADPMPTLELGYEKPAKKPRRELIRIAVSPEEVAGSNPEPEELTLAADKYNVDLTDIGASGLESSAANDSLLDSLKEEVVKLKESNAVLDAKVESLSKELASFHLKSTKKSSFSVNAIKKDSDMIFYTGLSIKVFD